MARRNSVSEPVSVNPNAPEVPIVPDGSRVRVKIQEHRLYRCVQCGVEYPTLQDGFYRSPHSVLFQDYKGFVPICKNCLHRLFTELRATVSERTLALQIMCAVMDLPYVKAQAELVADKAPSACLPAYIKAVRALERSKEARALTFMETLRKEREQLGVLQINQSRQQQEVQWDSQSTYNKDYIVDIVGYDPFEDASFSAADRKFLFNTMAGYCPDSSVSTDSHKLQSIINICIAQCQVHATDELINKELAKDAENVDDVSLTKFTSVKRDLLAAIDKLADNNEISAKTTKSGKGANTLSDRMRRIEKDKYRGIQVNRFDIETADAMQQIAEISMRAITSELQFQDNDYTDIIIRQRDLIQTMNSRVSELEEANRLLNNENVELKAALEQDEADE